VKAGSHTGESFTAWPCLPGPTMATLGAEASARRLSPQRLLRLHLLRDSSRGPDPISCHAVKTAAIASYTSDVISSALSALWLPTTATDRVFYSFSSGNPSDALSDHPSREETVVEHDPPYKSSDRGGWRRGIQSIPSCHGPARAASIFAARATELRRHGAGSRPSQNPRGQCNVAATHMRRAILSRLPRLSLQADTSAGRLAVRDYQRVVGRAGVRLNEDQHAQLSLSGGIGVPKVGGHSAAARDAETVRPAPRPNRG
jgi:hypothetical protein